MSSYILYIFIITSTIGHHSVTQQTPQIFVNSESCDYASSVIVNGLKSRLDPKDRLYTYCVPQQRLSTK